MQIIITEAEIKTAIRNHILQRMMFTTTQNIEVDLRATRGSEGYTAVIEIDESPKEPEAPSTASEQPKANAPATPIKKPETKAKLVFDPATRSQPVNEEPAAPVTQTAEEPVVEAGNEPVAEVVEAQASPAAAEDAPAPRRLFAGLAKPVNAKAADTVTA